MNRMNEKDIIQAALYFNYCATGSTMLKEEKANAYLDAFYKNLKERSIEYEYLYEPNQETFYFYERDKDNNGYYIIKPGSFVDSFDLCLKSGLGICSLEVLYVYCNCNVLEALGNEVRDSYYPKKKVKKV